MGDKKRITRLKRQAKRTYVEEFWDCSVCTFRNNAETFKCGICDVRKGTSTRKPRINSQLVAQQVAQQYVTPPPAKKEKKEKDEKQDKEKHDQEKEINPRVTKSSNQKTQHKSDVFKDHHSESESVQFENASTKADESNHISRPRLKNVDRSSAQQLAVTVRNVTVIITDYKEKICSSSTSSSTITARAESEHQNQNSNGLENTVKSSSSSPTLKGVVSAVNDDTS
ncbi:RING1 and YY1-binding protein-like [Ornithorhynchus anatinus]|uniref:RING1 and YY1 binding protein n=1 Tax=Ornithorhynchus anatinus TaxID=9258 RepID=A0A6I8NQF8_ORNAN|nr:RING1 and YY1-binding protein-like [Ornithorhynchus anatinus]